MHRLNRGITGSWWLVALNTYLTLSITGTTLLMIDPGHYKHTRTPARVLFSVPGTARGRKKRRQVFILTPQLSFEKISTSREPSLCFNRTRSC
jgi:hypothetical protein